MAEGQPRIAGKFVARNANGIDGIAAGNGQDTGSDIPVIDPAEIGNVAEPERAADSRPEKRGRGRPAGSGKRQEQVRIPGEKREALDVDFLSKVLLGVHKGLATITKIPELEIDAGESKMLSEASAQLMAEYDIKITARQKAWYQFYGALSFVYGTRLAVITFRKKAAKAEEPKATPVQEPAFNGLAL